MSVVLVTGGTGVLGSFAVPALRARGHQVRVLSRREGAGTHVGDLATGQGVAEAAHGVDWVVHLASDSAHGGRSDLQQTRQLLTACGGVTHLLYMSIVGIDEIPYRYYRNKLACERAVSSGGVPFTVWRATQFHELLEWGMRRLERVPVWPLPLPWQFQSIAAREVGERLVDVAEGGPQGRAADVGGPEVLALGDLVRTWREYRRRPYAVLNLPVPGRTSRAFREGRNTCPTHAVGRTTWAKYLGELPDNRTG